MLILFSPYRLYRPTRKIFFYSFVQGSSVNMKGIMKYLHGFIDVSIGVRIADYKACRQDAALDGLLK